MDGGDDVFEASEVLLPDDLGLSVHPLALAGVVVGISADDFLGDACHVQVIYDGDSEVKFRDIADSNEPQTFNTLLQVIRFLVASSAPSSTPETTETDLVPGTCDSPSQTPCHGIRLRSRPGAVNSG